MLIPGYRLLFWFAAIVLPFSFLGAVEPTARVLAMTAIGALLVLVIVDALSARFRFSGITVDLPLVARMSKDRDGRLEVRIQNSGQQARRVKLALGLPREIPSPQEEVELALPSGSEWSRFSWPCRPCKRGHYLIDAVHMEAHSPLRFWAARKRFAVRSEIRVYPNLLSDRRDLAALFLQRSSAGLHSQRQVGKGREFEKLREYAPGDSFEEIHWKATARRGRPITKVFQLERTQEIYVVIDGSRLSARLVPAPVKPVRTRSLSEPISSQPGTTLDRFITAALVLGLAAEQQGDLFGLLTFSDKIGNFVRARNGKAHYSGCRDALYLLEPQTVTPDYDEVCTFIRLRLRRRALLIFLTSLDDTVLAESFVRNMDLIRRQHLVLVNMLQPPGVGPLFSDPNVTSTNDLYQHLGGHDRWQTLCELQKILQRRGVRFSLLPNERLGAELVSQYLNVKRRQLL